MSKFSFPTGEGGGFICMKEIGRQREVASPIHHAEEFCEHWCTLDCLSGSKRYEF